MAKNIIAYILLAVLAVLCCILAVRLIKIFGQGEMAVDGEWELVWSDEFDYTGKPDASKWKYDVGGNGWGNGEIQYYTDGANAHVDGGKLKIELRPEIYNGYDYTSARIVSIEGWTYGRFEISARLPSGIGTWPAIWMLETNKTTEWPFGGEIDIMEHVGYNLNQVHHTVHTGRFNGMLGTHKGSSRYVEGATENFNIYALEWLPDKLEYYINRELVFTYDPSNYADPVTEQEWRFDRPFSLILNIAYGGTWGGQLGTDDSALPAVMEIDYVRVYQKSSR